MGNRIRAVAIGAAALGLAIAAAPRDEPKGAKMTGIAKGSFEVKVTPVPLADPVEGSNLGRMTIEKQFQGDLVGSGKGEMLTAMASLKGSGGYVAIERVTGTIAGRSGTFALQHTGTMNRGKPTLAISVVPDSGTGQLVGLEGTLEIKIEGKAHFYELHYTLADAAPAAEPVKGPE